MKKNLFLLWCRDALVGVSGAFGSAAVIQGFLIHYGLSPALISIYVTFGSVVNLVASLGLSGIASATKETVKVSSAFYLLSGIVSSAYLIFSLIKVGVTTMFALVMIVAGLSSIVVAVKNIFEYKLPCEVIDLEKYASYISVSGIISGIAGIGCGILVTLLYKVPDFKKISAVVFMISSLAMIIAGLINHNLKVINPTENSRDESKKVFGQLKILFKNKDFKFLILPNFFRGFGNALISLAAVFAVEITGFKESECAIISTLVSAGTLISCALYLPVINLLGRALSALVGAVSFCLIIPAFFSGNKIIFIILYTIAYVGFNITCNTIPDLIYQHISPEIISPFHTWRLALLTLGTTLGTTIFGYMLNKTAPILILVIGVVGYIVCGGAYYFYYRKKQPI